jgi:3-deoxy-D-manno-octulosonate 8-phosphate phosphatase KdsC-like HAD superfamily phosphatase
MVLIGKDNQTAIISSKNSREKENRVNKLKRLGYRGISNHRER